MKKTPGVAFYGKVRIPTIGHKTAIDTAKEINKRVGGKLTVGLSGTAEPLDIKTKKAHAERIFGHPVNTGTSETATLPAFLAHLNKSHDELHLVAGSDRVPEYKAFIDRYNGKKDKKGNVPFNFRRIEVHTAGGERTESDKDPTKMSRQELTSSVSASKLEKLAKEGNWEHFKAYHPDMPERHVRKVYSQIRKFHSAPKSIKKLKENFAIGLTFARKEMPQIGASGSFVKYLKSNDVQSKRTKLDPNELKSSQMEFDQDKIEGLRNTPSSNPIIVSRDNHVIDGHHRWLADKLEDRDCDAYMCDLPVLELLHQAKIYSKQLKEEMTRKELAPMLDSFVSFASDKLGLKSMPSVRYKSDDDNYNSFAAYNPSSNELSISTMNRHPMDIFRSVAHELVHHKQNEDGRLGKDIAKEGATGSDIENEANSEAGKIMRWFAKANPDMFGKSYVVENNTTGLGGIRGLGNVTGEVSPTQTSQYVVDNEAETKKMQGNHLSGLWFDDGTKSYWLDEKGKNEYQKKATKSFKNLRENLNEGINDPGKLKAIFLAGGPGSGKDFVMNSALAGEGLREVNSDNAFEYLMKKHGLDMEMPEEEKLERDIVRGRAKNITKEQERLALAGRLGVIINGTADDVEKIKTIKKNLEDVGYETMMVFVNTSNEVSRQRNVDRGKGGGRKVPDGTNKQGVPNGSEDIRTEKWELAQKNIGELQKVFGNENFAIIDNSVDIRKADQETKNKVLTDFSRVRRMAQQFVRAENKNPAAAKWISGEAEKRGITYQEPKRYKSLTQIRQSVPNVVHKPDNELMAQARRLGLSYYGFGRFGRKVNGINKVLYHSKGGQLVKAQLNEDLRKWFREKWVRFDTKGNIKGPCAREAGEGKPKCRPLASARAMGKEERAKSARRKRREDPVADRSGKGNKPINVQTEAKNWAQQAAIAIAKKKSGKYDKEGKRLDETLLTEKNKPTNPELWARAKSLAKQKFDVYPSAYANGWASKWYKSKGGGWKTVSEEKGSCWDGYKMEGMKKKGNRMVPNCVPVNEAFENFVSEEKKKIVPKKKKLSQEAAEASVQGGMNFGADGIGPTIAVPRAGTPYGFGYGSAYSVGLSESIVAWMQSEKTQQKFINKYGDLWEDKLVEAALRLEEAGCGCEHSEKKSVKKLREGMEGGVNNMSMIPTQRKGDQEVDEEKSPAWTRKEGKSESGGLNRKGIASYRRANPGSKLSMAVTTKPSKLKKGSKAANRRKSFCARMGGMKKRLTSAKTARDPNSRINKALRKWNCEE